MEKRPFLTEEQAQEIIQDVPTPFHVYDEKGIRENARRINKAFSWNKGFREYFAVKALPNPIILQILKEEGCGVDCSSLTELMLSEACGFTGSDIMFSSNQTPVEDMKKAYELGAYINLDDATMVDFLDRVAGIPENIFCRYNPGGTFQLGESEEGFQVMDKPGDAKYGMTEEQMIDSYKKLMAKGAKNFGIHAFLASNTISDAYYPELAGILFQLAVRVQKATGAHIGYINLSGGVGIPYRPDQTENDIMAIGEGVRRKFEEILVPAGMGDVAIFTEMGRFTTGPYGALVATAIHEKHIYKEYIGLDACAHQHSITVPMIAACKFDDLIFPCITSCHTDCTHNSLCTRIDHSDHIHMRDSVTDKFSHFHFDLCSASKAQTFFTGLQNTFPYCRKIVSQDHWSPGIYVINIAVAIYIINIAAFCTFNKSRCFSNSAICTHRTVYTARDSFYRSLKKLLRLCHYPILPSSIIFAISSAK